jgi:hypothetical protein
MGKFPRDLQQTAAPAKHFTTLSRYFAAPMRQFGASTQQKASSMRQFGTFTEYFGLNALKFARQLSQFAAITRQNR